MNREQVFEFFRRLAEANPSPTTELDFINPYTLLVAVVLSAQATDASVNIATEPLFKHIKTPRQMIDFGEEKLREAIRTIGLFNTKAKNVIALSQALIENHGGEVPRTREELQELPGVGRKTANVVLNTAWGEETFAVDTHVFRVCNRTGLAPGKTVEEVEAKLEKIVPQPFRRDAHHWLILHGRYTCKARLPECWRCPVIDLCRYKPKTPPPEERTKPSAARTASRASSKARTAPRRTASKRSGGRSRARPNRLP
ncbi:MAG TPA: endonuclease III [Sphingomicrobium sp.]|nr:endonuclease III [Sphingomicrobium sp.]